jgi:aryl-alcohol dehydrogenase-like predicted oxidoreductase
MGCRHAYGNTRGRALAQLVLQFVTAHTAVTALIPDSKTAGQLADNLKAALLPPLTDDQLALITAVTSVGGGRQIWPA